MKILSRLVLAGLLTAGLTTATANNLSNKHSPGQLSGTDEPLENATGLQIMQAVERLQMAFPAVFERQSMILVDASGNRETRKLRRYSRINRDGSGEYLLLLDSPTDVAGVALLASQSADGQMTRQLYLPALGGKIISNTEQALAAADALNNDHLSPVLGSDFSIEDLSGDNLTHYRYERQRDRRIEGAEYYQIAVYNKAANPLTAVAVKRHYVQKNRMVITRTDYFNEFGELSKQRSAHDIQAVSNGIWQPNMQLLNNIKAAHQSIIKIEQRVFSADYLPTDVFTTGWLLANHPPLLPPAETTKLTTTSQSATAEPLAEELPAELLKKFSAPATEETKTSAGVPTL